MRKHSITKLLDFGSGFYDPLLRVVVNEIRFRQDLLELAAIGEHEKVLDVGSGTGSLCELVAESQVTKAIYGIDISEKMVYHARKKAKNKHYEIEYRIGSSTNLPYDEGQFDVVLSSLLYHHLDYEGKAETLGEIRRVLKHSGKYVCGEFREFPAGWFHKIVLELTSHSGILHGLYPPNLVEDARFKVEAVIDGPCLGGHHPISYWLMKTRSNNGRRGEEN